MRLLVETCVDRARSARPTRFQGEPVLWNLELFGTTLWVPIIRSWALTRGYALHPGTSCVASFTGSGGLLAVRRGRSKDLVLCRLNDTGSTTGVSRGRRHPLMPYPNPRQTTRDHRPTAPARRAAPPQQPTAAGRRGPGPAWCCRCGPAPTAASRLARHVGDLVALAPAANRQTPDPTLGNAGPTIHLRLASSSHPRNGQRQPCGCPKWCHG